MSIDYSADRTNGYGELAREVRRSGLMARRPWFYARLSTALLVTGTVVVVAMMRWSDSWALLMLAPVLAVVSTQFGFLGHDVGHRQVARSARRSRTLGVVCGDLLTGLSYEWWVTKHNAHHAHPNDLDSDPDVAAGALVFGVGQAARRHGFAAWVTRHQAVLFFPMLTLEAVNLHVSSVREMFRPGVPWRAAESSLLALHVTGYVTLLALTLTLPQALTFAAVHKAVQGVYLGVAFAPGHKGMPVLDEEQSSDPLLRQVLTSRNLRGNRMLDAALGGLNFQIEHHLFPSMPRPNLRLAQPLVREFCLRRGVTYTEVAPLASYRIGLRHLHEVGQTLRS
jgi:fatty acid desaturase